MLATGSRGSSSHGKRRALSPEPTFCDARVRGRQRAIHALPRQARPITRPRASVSTRLHRDQLDTHMSNEAQQSREILGTCMRQSSRFKGIDSRGRCGRRCRILSSDAARCMTGDTTAIDGGWHVRTEGERLVRTISWVRLSSRIGMQTSAPLLPARGCPRTSSSASSSSNSITMTF